MDSLCNTIPNCPVCGGTMDLVYDQPAMKVCMCGDCHTGVHVPIKAWDLLRAKARAREAPAPRVVRPERDKDTGQAPPEDIDGGPGDPAVPPVDPRAT